MVRLACEVQLVVLVRVDRVVWDVWVVRLVRVVKVVRLVMEENFKKVYTKVYKSI